MQPRIFLNIAGSLSVGPTHKKNVFLKTNNKTGIPTVITFNVVLILGRAIRQVKDVFSESLFCKNRYNTGRGQTESSLVSTRLHQNQLFA